MQSGDFVFILERKLLDNGWEVGIVEEVTPSPDGQALNALVGTPRGVARRAALHLALLPKEQGDEKDL